MDHPDYYNDVRDFLPRKVVLIRRKASEAVSNFNMFDICICTCMQLINVLQTS